MNKYLSIGTSVIVKISASQNKTIVIMNRSYYYFSACFSYSLVIFIHLLCNFENSFCLVSFIKQKISNCCIYGHILRTLIVLVLNKSYGV
jgi:hypothetical protein